MALRGNGLANFINMPRVFFLCNLVNETKLVHNLFSAHFVNFIYKLYTFRTSPDPSSGGTIVFTRHLVLVILYSRLSGMQDGMISSGGTTLFMRHLVLVILYSCLVCRLEWYHSILRTRPSAMQNNKYQLSHKYSYSSWWWAWRDPKHVEVVNKIDETHWQ
jgi:hypothetical protein